MWNKVGGRVFKTCGKKECVVEHQREIARNFYKTHPRYQQEKTPEQKEHQKQYKQKYRITHREKYRDYMREYMRKKRNPGKKS